MNIHGYKLKKAAIRRMLNREEAKPREEQSQRKIYRLECSLKDCGNRIRRLKAAREKGHGTR